MTGDNSSQNTQESLRHGEIQYNVRDAALRGAAFAFSKPPVKPKPLISTYTSDSNGALAAATVAGMGVQQAPSISSVQIITPTVRKQWTGGSHRPIASPVQPSKTNSSGTLEIPFESPSNRSSSPSNIAAKLAAARASPRKLNSDPHSSALLNQREIEHGDALLPAGSVGPAKARLKPLEKQPSRQRSNSIGAEMYMSDNKNLSPKDRKATDDSSILPTTSLVRLFEQDRFKTSASPKPDTILTARGVLTPVESPKPQRRAPIFLHEKPDLPPPKNEQNEDGKRVTAKPKPSAPLALKTTAEPPKPPPQRRSRPPSQEAPTTHHLRRSLSGSLDGMENDSSSSSYASAPESHAEMKAKPDVPPPRRSRTKTDSLVPSTEIEPQQKPRPPIVPAKSKISTMVSQPTRLATPETFLPSRPTPLATESYPTSSTYHSNYQRQSLRQITPHMTGDSLANAMVGAALASSHYVSPPPALPSRHQQPKKHHYHHFHSPSRSASPPKRKSEPGKLLTTMRKDSSSSEDESERYKRKGKRVLGVGRKHPNKHHEGARKRWRDTITERERKRYEGVWAANRGLHIPLPKSPSPSPNSLDEFTGPAHEVVNLVVKDIWSRSRLPEHVLEEVWALVDSRGVGRLRREEYVVGMWLIDQALKGRKLPIRVSESVWGSVRGVGVDVRLRSGKGPG